MANSCLTFKEGSVRLWARGLHHTGLRLLTEVQTACTGPPGGGACSCGQRGALLRGRGPGSGSRRYWRQATLCPSNGPTFQRLTPTAGPSDSAGSAGAETGWSILRHLHSYGDSVTAAREDGAGWSLTGSSTQKRHTPFASTPFRWPKQVTWP